MEFRRLIHNIAEGLKKEDLIMIKYLCKDALHYNADFTEALEFFNYFETKGWITSSELSFLAEILYRINRHDLLKLLPGVKNRKSYEENFRQQHSNFKPFRIACFQLIDELTSTDFHKLKNFCRDQLSFRNFQKSLDIISLLVCLEEEDILCEDDLHFILECLQQLDNQVPYKTFFRLSQGDFSIVVPKIHQRGFHSTSASSIYHSESAPSVHPNPPPFNPSYKSEGNFGNIHPVSKHMNFQGDTSGAETNPSKFFVGAPDGSESNLKPTSSNSPSTPYRPVEHSLFTNRMSSLTRQMQSCSAGPTVDSPSNSTRFSEAKVIQDTTVVKEVDPTPSTRTAGNPNTLQPIVHSLANLTYTTKPRNNSSVAHSLLLGSSSPQQVLNRNIPESNPGRGFFSFSQENVNCTLPVTVLDGTSNRTGLSAIAGDQEPITSPPCLEECEKLECYPMSNPVAGICLIINNSKFCTSPNSSTSNASNANSPSSSSNRFQQSLWNNSGLSDRIGSEKDVENVSELFKRLRFDVRIKEDLDARSMLQKLKDMAKTDHKEYDCFVLVVMSHGGKGFVYGSDGEKVHYATIKSFFKPSSCPSLIGKPKIIFAQACQMDAVPPTPPSQSNSDDLEQDGLFVDTSLCNADADFLFCYATVPGSPAFRSKSKGSIFINVVVNTLKTYYKSHDLLSIMIKVNNEVSKQTVLQISMPVPTLRGKIFFRDIEQLQFLSGSVAVST